jgi:hypothetical protein
VDQEEYSQLEIKENGSYTRIGNQLVTNGLPDGNQPATQIRLGKDSIDNIDARQARLVRPSLEDISAYCQERKNRVDPQAWLDHYESNGWKVGKNPMKDWRAAVRTWERGDFAKPTASSPSYSSTPSLKPVTMTPEEREMYARTYQRGDK